MIFEHSTNIEFHQMMFKSIVIESIANFTEFKQR